MENENIYRLVVGSKTKDARRLRCGYTTGTCAAAAAKAAAAMLFSGETLLRIEIDTPHGIVFNLELQNITRGEGWVSCAVQKDAGDDPDITDGVLVYAKVEKRGGAGVLIDGGEGVGRVTKPGLDRKPGEAAINSTPRKMIEAVCACAAAAAGYTAALAVTISIPDGILLAEKTFNPKVGIVGGISVLGSSGIVEPMSERAYIESMHIDIKQRYACISSDCVEPALLVCAGNFARAFASEALGLSGAAHIKCSNFSGDALVFAAETGFKQALLVGHLGKLVKLGIGMTNTHSSNGDGRLETLIACALEAGASIKTLRAIASCATTDAAVTILEKAGILQPVMSVLERHVSETLRRLLPPEMETGFAIFGKGADGNGRILAQSENAQKLIDKIKSQMVRTRSGSKIYEERFTHLIYHDKCHNLK